MELSDDYFQTGIVSFQKITTHEKFKRLFTFIAVEQLCFLGTKQSDCGGCCQFKIGDGFYRKNLPTAKSGR